MRQYYFKPGSTEKVIQVIRQHPIILLANLSFGTAMIVLGLIGMDLARQLALPAEIPSSVLGIVWAVYFIVAALVLYAGWFIYSRTEVIITNEHLVDVDQRSLVSREVSKLELGKVQDVSADRNGVLQTLLDYGLVTVQTAGEHEFFELQNLPQPDRVASEFTSLFPRTDKADPIVEPEVGSTEQKDSSSQ